MNFWSILLVAGKITGLLLIICVFARFITWKAIKDYEAEKKQKAVDFQGVVKGDKKIKNIDISA